MQIILLRQRQFWQKNARASWTSIFALGIIDDDRCDGKHQKQLFYSTNPPPPFLVVEFSNTSPAESGRILGEPGTWF